MRRVTVIQKLKTVDAVFPQVIALQLYCNSRCNSGVWSLLHHNRNRIVQCGTDACRNMHGTGANCAKGKISIKYQKITYIQNHMCLQRSNFTAARFCA